MAIGFLIGTGTSSECLWVMWSRGSDEGEEIQAVCLCALSFALIQTFLLVYAIPRA